ncbi:MAG: hypothetical protein OEO79_07015 [Gemmatimonadota bacterium]|nr:hypothetical protein [Gemmatimonadota bacterium]MDH3421746.1 hypothetical protein [Gemmatimonadota bacterium]
MSATPVERLNAALEGRYHIESELGEGGMATVGQGRAGDTRVLGGGRFVGRLLRPEPVAVA